MNYTIVIEETTLGYSAYCPDVDGCVATGSTPEGVAEAMETLIDGHLQWLRERGHDCSARRRAANRPRCS
ncbi:hypothetical protein Tgr7_0592 [Thioalkalivibrio sulfidiphilus HL-EbGr7]|uniref:HicB-like antitoxin of toxin-antitoxin system domain-containing protein n=1 Tax=Thioalkalivibrio sulfidiphilus (strain HL-EbGR7) TaxID=396588 RepID=B8GLT6_THISH|nr:type II toxin-antitoxin system HicB family antitoxin [Thioalkalivibrio sulfidiphilus]ACL71689.1 hypothetical protein Tgr7_0592 [Thioalkalivibrio sulfidiphilus HL-EbGr7]